MPQVQVVSRVWARDSHGLFDFEASNAQPKTFAVPSSREFFRSGTDVQMQNEHGRLPPSSEALIRLTQTDGNFMVKPSRSSKKPYLVVKDLPTSSYPLSEGDVFKTGRFRFRVAQVATASGTQTDLRLGNSGVCRQVEPSEAGVCRYCYMEGDENDPLVAPCNCSGSTEYVHLSCLRQWANVRHEKIGKRDRRRFLRVTDAVRGSYFYKPQSCEICKSPYSPYVGVAGQRRPLVDVPQTEPPFIVLENMTNDSKQLNEKCLHVMSLANGRVLKIGRSHDCDVRAEDVSLSRVHASIRFHDGQFMLEDNHSKFGTGVAMKEPCALDAGSAISIQVGSAVLSLTLQSCPDAITEGSTPQEQQTTDSAQDEHTSCHSPRSCDEKEMPLVDLMGE